MDNIIANINTTKYLLDKYNLKAKRSLGQNFIVDNNIIKRLIDHAKIQENTAIIEIGPGLGALTQALLKKAEKVISIDIDKNMVALLDDLFGQKANFQIIHADILEFDLIDLIIELKKDYKYVMIISNLPYYITSDILKKIFRIHKMVDLVLIMVQKEFAQRLIADKSTKDYRTLTVLAKSLYKSTILFNISKHVFYPRPNIDSAVVLMENLKDDFIDLEKYITFIEMCFTQKRQTIFNNLRKYLDKDLVTNILETSKIDKNARAADLEVIEFKKMFEVYYEV